ncbi:hypothetical protein K474DRAFT_1602501, partial [Panus rudis PR-1116 ss-1]
LITIIEDNPQIKQGLFPSPGGHVSTAKGGGKAKTDHYWQICIALFKGHPLYAAAFAAAIAENAKASLRNPWVLKIKNRIKA